MEHDYRHVVSVLPSDWNTRASFRRVLDTLDRTSSPGLPYMRVAPTISEYLYKGGLNPDPTREEELWVDVKRVLQCDYDHVWRAFLKMD